MRISKYIENNSLGLGLVKVLAMLRVLAQQRLGHMRAHAGGDAVILVGRSKHVYGAEEGFSVLSQKNILLIILPCRSVHEEDQR